MYHNRCIMNDPKRVDIVFIIKESPTALQGFNESNSFKSNASTINTPASIGRIGTS